MIESTSCALPLMPRYLPFLRRSFQNPPNFLDFTSLFTILLRSDLVLSLRHLKRAERND